MKWLEARPHEAGWIARMRMVRHDIGHGMAKRRLVINRKAWIKIGASDAAKLVRTDHEYKLWPV
jgi:hypothetical protein